MSGTPRARTPAEAPVPVRHRNKRTITLDFTKPEGRALARRMVAQSDILLENYKVGTLARYDLGYEQLKDEFPGLIYCSVTGFGRPGLMRRAPVTISWCRRWAGS